MKKIIDNRVYDTDKAKLLGSYSWGAISDFKWYNEELYRKKTGEFFLYGKGNAASPYAEACKYGGYDPGEKIIPLTYKAAQKWAEESLETDDYINIFGEPEEDGSTEALHIRISAAKMAKLRQAASRDGLTLVALVERLIDNL